MTSKRIYGRKLCMLVGQDRYDGDVISYTLSQDDKADGLTFGDIATGIISGTLKIKAIQSTEAKSFWRFCWEHTGEAAKVRLAPHGNETASDAEPFVDFEATIGNIPDLGGDAGVDSVFDFETEWSGRITKTLVSSGALTAVDGG
ncbi:hypothetical protein JMX17_06720 [Cutibacterium avidum]|uniref:hypothetical protein n=1 Tax=Cutibacterium avidum TaxID=33010 RepID=UPI00192B619C|nr:hypothetical protein [Cutibacterium avidum]MDU5416716.1 hypothetical protein [Cutibacterium avidum]MDU5420284.1 hypothetical protein [Cutibacterium avidum]QQY11872.1 hypothetical protein JMX17_06720 [Cutibacterium avidum]